MPYHGVFVYEIPTSIVAPVRVPSAMPVFIGAAPVHRATRPPKNLFEPTIIFSYAEAVETLGYADDWEKYPLCEAMFSQLRLYGVAPAVFINVFDPTKNASPVSGKDIQMRNGRVEINDINAVTTSVVVRVTASGPEMMPEEDYRIEITGHGLTIISLPGGGLFGKTSMFVEYSVVDPTAVTANDIIGGVEPSTGRRTGIEAVEDVFPRTRLVPAILVAYGPEDSNDIRIMLIAKAMKINGLFKCIAVVDIPESSVATYREAPSWKELNGVTAENCITCFGKIRMGSRVFRLSTQLTGLMGRVDNKWGGVPFASPSNNRLEMDGMLWRGEELFLPHDQASYLGHQGIVTALNFTRGWVAWNSRTAIYPGVTDPKDMWIPVRRMFSWFANELILTYWQMVDMPIRPVLIDNICSTLNMRLAGLTSQGYLLGGRVEWNHEGPVPNPKPDLIDGIIRFHVFMAPPPPAETIEFWLEYDPGYFDTLGQSLIT